MAAIRLMGNFIDAFFECDNTAPTLENEKESNEVETWKNT